MCIYLKIKQKTLKHRVDISASMCVQSLSERYFAHIQSAIERYYAHVQSAIERTISHSLFY